MVHIRSQYFSTFFFVATFTNAGKASFFLAWHADAHTHGSVFDFMWALPGDRT